MTKIKMMLNFVQTDPLDIPKRLEKEVVFDSKGEYLVECYPVCINGGYDLTREVRNLMASENQTITGSMICKGKQRKHTRHSCLRELKYALEKTQEDF